MRVRLPDGSPLPPQWEQPFSEMRDQLIIVFLRRILKARTGDLTLSAAEIDDTSDAFLAMEIDANGRTFTFKLSKKS